MSPACFADAATPTTITTISIPSGVFTSHHHLSLPLSGVVFPSTNTTATTNSNDWSSSMSAGLYRLDRWGPPYFDVNPSGNIIIRPFGDSTLPHQEIDLLKVVKKVSDSKSNGGLGLQFPLVVRFPDVLKHRLESLQSAFNYAIESNEYGSHYQGVYPVKCNQDRFVVEDIVRFGSGFRFGLEAGSKPELLLAMSSLCKGHPDAFLVCNGFKDAEYISLAIVARKLALNTVIVLEQEEEVDLVIELSQLLRTRPVIGVRAKLRTKHAGHFGSTSGEKGKFGLTTVQILRVVRKLDAVGMLDCLQLLHFHIGSQIPSTELLIDGVSEGAQVYCELVRLGACMSVIDIGGGLGIDYDGSKSTESDISVGYTLDEYASAVVRAVQVVCDRKGIKHPVICSESGRAIVSHHSILVFEAVSATGAAAAAAPPVMSSVEVEYLAKELKGEAREEFDKMYASAMRQEYDGCLMYAENMKQHCIDQFKDGCLTMEQLAAVDGLCEMVSKALGVGESMSTYHVNLSIFTSIPDFWGIGQLFPVIPIHKLDQRPGVRGILSDLTCDSDGKIDKFIGGESSLPLHEIRRDNGNVGGGYYLGMFLGGAYEEALGGVHNLFGGPSVVRVLQSDGPHSFAVTRAVPGPSSGDVLRVMQHEPELMFEALKHRAEECLNHDNKHDRIDTASLADGLAQSFNNMPYLVAGPTATTSGFVNTSSNNGNGYHHPYFCGAEDSCCNGNVVEVAKAEDEQWSYVCA